jgi:hypothetical protein
MKRVGWQVRLGIGLVVASALLYLGQYLVFRDTRNLLISLISNIAFVPVQVLLVTLIIHQMLGERERRSRLEKLNMVIGAFFSVVGTKLLVYISDFDPRLPALRKELMIRPGWTDAEFAGVARRLMAFKFAVDIKRIDLERLRGMLTDNRDFLVRLLENPSVLEHESFTGLLRAVFHVTEELEARPDFRSLPEADLAHIAGDITRAYGPLVGQWLDYMEHLKNNYPYLFSLAMRTNPFDQEASPIVKT